MTQNSRIIQYLERYGSISPIEAVHELGITKLSTRIGEIERGGTKIRKAYEETENRYGEKTRYMRYSLEAEH